MENKKLINVKVCYAKPDYQEIISITLPTGSNILSAIQHSGIMYKFPEIDLSVNSVGIFGYITSLKHILSDNDRVEIYRPLRKNPMEARRLRAELNK